MRSVLVAASVAVLSVAGMCLPAAASGSSEDVFEQTVIWSDSGQPQFVRRRVAKATITDTDEELAATRRSYQSDDEDRPRYTKRHHGRTAKRSRRHHRAARRSSHRPAHHRAARRSTREAARHHAARHSTRRSAQMRSRRSHRADRRRWATRRGGWEGTGIASYYWQGRRVATGARFNPEGLTAAHRTLPFGTRVRVTHMGNGRSVNVVINDRGPFIAGRIIDLARGAARVIGMTGQGLARVRVTVLSR